MTRSSSRNVICFFVGVFCDPRCPGRRFGRTASNSAGSTSRAGRILAISALVSWRTSPSARVSGGRLVSGLFGMMANLASTGLAKANDPNPTLDRREADRMQPIPQMAQGNKPLLRIVPAGVPSIDRAAPIEIVRPVEREFAQLRVALALGRIEFNSHNLM